jgi:hypothetical protein
MWNVAKQRLDRGELRSVVHFVFLSPKNHPVSQVSVPICGVFSYVRIRAATYAPKARSTARQLRTSPDIEGPVRHNSTPPMARGLMLGAGFLALRAQVDVAEESGKRARA